MEIKNVITNRKSTDYQSTGIVKVCFASFTCVTVCERSILFCLVTSLAKEVMFLAALVSLSVCLFVCLFVCLSVDNITQKVMNGLG